MALEIKFKINNWGGEEVDSAGYLVIDSDRAVVAEGFTSIAIDGSVIIPISSSYVSLNEKVRPTIDDFDGSNYELAGTASDWVAVTEVYAPFSMSLGSDGFTLTCVNESGVYGTWDFGDGTTTTSRHPVHIFFKNGDYTVTNGTFTQDVSITKIREFGVVLDGATITCTTQSGFEANWGFGNGDADFSGDDVVEYTYYENGTYTVSFGDFTKEITVDYYTPSMLVSVEGNKATFDRPTGAVGDVEYGDNTASDALIYQYPMHGKYIAGIDEYRVVVNVPTQLMPVINYVSRVSEEDSAIITFEAFGATEYEWDINGNSYNTKTAVVDFNSAGAGIYKVKCTGYDAYGNSSFAEGEIYVRLINVGPVIIEVGVTSQLLVAFFTITAEDSIGETLSYAWEFSDGRTSSLRNPSLTFYEEGSVSGTCTVSDDRGGSVVSETVSVTLTESYPTGVELVANGDFAVDDNMADWANYNAIHTWSGDIREDGTNETGVIVSGSNSNSGKLTLTVPVKGDTSYLFTTLLKVGHTNNYTLVSVPSSTGTSYYQAKATEVDVWETTEVTFKTPVGTTSIGLLIQPKQDTYPVMRISTISLKEVF